METSQVAQWLDPELWAHWSGDLFGLLGVEAAWLGVLSFIMFVGSVALVPLVIRSLPADYYCLNRANGRRRHPVVEIVVMSIKNTLGALLILAGIAMLVLPGQGLLTIVLGIALVDFPGKKAFERRLLRNEALFSSLNWLRRKMGKPAFTLEC